MMKKVIRKNNGITLVSVSIVVIVILILTAVIIYNIRDSLGINNLQAMQNDIQNLRDKVNNYYSINGKIPAELRYTNEDNLAKIREAGVISEKVDIGDYYIIDLDELENLTLNYGEDYKNITSTTTEQEAGQYKDIYIINETSQNIFYVEGIEVDNEWFYTDYTSEEVDTVGVNLRYFDNVKIPEGFYYVGGAKEEGIVISDNIEDLGKGTSHEVAQTLKGNQFVWVPVENDDDFKRYAGYYNGGLQSDWFGNCVEPADEGYTLEQLEYDEMKESVLKYNGFYVGRYEAGTSTKRTSTSGNEDKLVVKQGVNPYNWIGWSNSNDMSVETGGAVQKSKEFDDENGYTSVTSTLIYGAQWDAIMQWIDSEYKNGNCDTNTSFVANSTGKGNHSGTISLTGSNSEFAVNNIYDLAGNVWEWSMETYLNHSKMGRGGSYVYSGFYSPASNRGYRNPSLKYEEMGFRIALYLNLDEEWSPTYDKEGTYTDKNGDTAYIPKGFQVSEKGGETLIDEGLVVRNTATDDRYVWIEVPKSIYQTATSETDYENIEKDMQTYAATYRDNSEGFSDTWYNGCGIATEEEYNNLKNEMLASVYENGGFYISRYEIGAESYVTANDNGARSPVSKEGMYPYNYVTVAQAQNLATNMDSGEKTSSLMFGIQWDLVCKFIETKGRNPGNTVNTMVDAIKTNSQDWGNTWLAIFDIYKGEYNHLQNKTGWTKVDSSYHKTGIALLTTGASDRNKMLNIYDFSGNVWEWTLEYSEENNYNVVRGGSANSHTDHSMASYRLKDWDATYENGNNISAFRTTIF